LFIEGILLTNFLYKRSHKIGLKRNITNLPRWSSQTKPILGGVVFFFVVLSGFIITNFWLDKNFLLYKFNSILFFSITLSFIMGLADDLLNTSPYFKFVVQFIIAIVFIYSGFYIKFFDNTYLNYILTIFWVVGIINSVNMLDNMDAIATSTIFIISAALVFISFVLEKFDLAIIMFLTLPSLLAFLFFNWPPSKMYMGDNGSQMLGTLIAGLGIIFVWNAGIENNLLHFDVVLSVGLMFLLLLTDTTTVTVNRLLKGKSPFKGDKNHTTHCLVKRGFSEKQVAIIFITITLFSSAIAATIITGYIKLNIIYRIILSVFLISVFLLLYINSKLKSNEN